MRRAAARRRAMMGAVLSTAYFDAVMALSPHRYLRLGESSGVTAVDAAGTANGTYGNTPTLGVTGIPGGGGDTAITLAAASSEYVSLGNSDVLHGLSSMAAGIWVKPTSLPGASQVYMSLFDSSGADRAWMLSVESTNLVLRVYSHPTGLSTATVAISGLLSIGSWTPLFWTWDSGGDGKGRIYSTAGLVATAGTATTSTMRIVPTYTTPYLGCDTTAGTRRTFADSTFDECSIWKNATITAGQIANLISIGESA